MGTGFSLKLKKIIIRTSRSDFTQKLLVKENSKNSNLTPGWSLKKCGLKEGKGCLLK